MLDNLVIVAYFLAVFGIGIYYSRRPKETASEYFLAGNSIGWFAVGASLFSTNISSEHFIGLAGSGASSGLAVGCYEWSASFCLFLLGWLFVPHYLKAKVFTMPEFLSRRFDERCRWYLTVVSLIAYVFTKISVHLFAGAILMRSVLGWDYLTTSILLVVATGIYTITGGLKAVIYTDLFQSFVLITGAVVLSAVGLYHVGGFTGLRAALPPDFFHMIKPASDPTYPWVGTIFGTMILGTWYWCTDQSIVQKTLSANGLENARKGAFFCATLKILPVFILVLPGLIAKALYPNVVNGDNAYPTLVLRLLPKGLVGLMVAALLAALMSAMSSVLNSCSTLITMDIFRKTHPHASQKRLVYIGRVATGVIVVVSILWVPLIKYLSNEIYQYLQSVQAYIGAPITAVFLVGVLWKRATARAAFTTLITGGLMGAIRFLMDVMHDAMKMDLGIWNNLVKFSFLNFSVCVFAFCVLLMVVMSLMEPQRTAEAEEKLTLHWGGHGERIFDRIDVAWTGLVGAFLVGLWVHFS
ncbi:MAG TPA: sodium:solute symporter [Bryobacteraceae bacterium]|nr:sodium:solute symporter [Bryobacteraceae bacterium]